MASDFKLFKKKDDKKNNGQNFSLSDKSKFAIVESYKAARTNIMFSLSAKEKNALPYPVTQRVRARAPFPQILQFSFQKWKKEFSLSTATFAVLMFTTFLSLTIRRDLPM